MKKILFVVCTHGDDLAGLKLFMEYPYGKTKYVEWEVIIGNPQALTLNQRYIESDLNRSFNTLLPHQYEAQRAKALKKRFKPYDVIYDIHTTRTITSPDIDDMMFINNRDPETLKACVFIEAPHIIWDSDTQKQKQYLTAAHPLGITLEYQKTADANNDYARIKADFLNIIHNRISKKAPKHLYEASIPVTHEQRKELHLDFQDFKKLDLPDKRVLLLPKEEEYVPIFVNSEEVDPQYYCFLNKKIRDVIHISAWLQHSKISV